MLQIYSVFFDLAEKIYEGHDLKNALLHHVQRICERECKENLKDDVEVKLDPSSLS